MYEIIKNGIDDYTLKYKEKELKFKSDIENITKLQSINELAEEELIFKLAEKGKSVQDLTIKRFANGKTYYDSSNKNELLNVYKEKIIKKIISDVCETQLKMSLSDLVEDIGLGNGEEIVKLATELSQAFAGKFPSEEKGKQKK